MSFLEVKNLKKKYGDTQILKGIDVSLEKGEVLAVIGSSGGGKTTFLRCLNFLTMPDSGTISVDGDLLFDGKKACAGRKEMRTKRLHFGLVFQSFNLFPQYTVKRNITLAMDLHGEKRLKTQGIKYFERKRQMKDVRARNERISMEILDRVGLADKADFYPWQLSGGQCQRAAIGRALALNPDILCFDEPTSALDPELTGEVLKVIRELKAHNFTMIIVTHEMAFAESVADKVIFIADGEIAEEGSPEKVFHHPENEKTWAFLRRSEEE